MSKIDLIMWTLNSEETLLFTLKGIRKAIPDKFIGRKIIVDGGSKDLTENIADLYNWEFHKCKKGIPYQANMALEMIETPIFASFEHDIILCENWYLKIKDTIKLKNVAVSQGVRLSTNHILNAIERYCLLRDNIRHSSIDNNLYKTKIIRDLGGFDIGFPVSCDRDLEDRVRAINYKWLVNRNIISIHIKPSLKNYAQNVYNATLIHDYFKERISFLDMLQKFITSPFIGFMVATKFKCPLAFLGYPYWRWYKLKTAIELSLKK